MQVINKTLSNQKTSLNFLCKKRKQKLTDPDKLLVSKKHHLSTKTAFIPFQICCVTGKDSEAFFLNKGSGNDSNQ